MLMEQLQKIPFLFLILLFVMFSYNEVCGQDPDDLGGEFRELDDIAGAAVSTII